MIIILFKDVFSTAVVMSSKICEDSSRMRLDKVKKIMAYWRVQSCILAKDTEENLSH
jgi:hypothetical protein